MERNWATNGSGIKPLFWIGVPRDHAPFGRQVPHVANDRIIQLPRTLAATPGLSEEAEDLELDAMALRSIQRPGQARTASAT
jgi:hypothetical protein